MTNGPAQVETLNGVTVVSLQGDIDMHSAGDVEAMLDELIGEGAQDIVVDLDHVDFLGSAVIGALVGYAARARRHEHDLRLCNVPPKVAEIMEMMGVPEFVPTFSDRTAALLAGPEETWEALGVHDRRAGPDRRDPNTPFDGTDRRGSDRRGD